MFRPRGRAKGARRPKPPLRVRIPRGTRPFFPTSLDPFKDKNGRCPPTCGAGKQFKLERLRSNFMARVKSPFLKSNRTFFGTSSFSHDRERCGCPPPELALPLLPLTVPSPSGIIQQSYLSKSPVGAGRALFPSLSQSPSLPSSGCSCLYGPIPAQLPPRNPYGFSKFILSLSYMPFCSRKGRATINKHKPRPRFGLVCVEKRPPMEEAVVAVYLLYEAILPLWLRNSGTVV